MLTPDRPLVIGRNVDGLILEDERLSRAHLSIAWDGRSGGYRYADLGSANGTFVNGAWRSEGFLLEGDVLRVGDTLLLATIVSGTSVVEVPQRVATSDLPVLVLGETGAGKELLARKIHEQSGRSGPFVPVNVATLSPELAAAELFGHVRGAFSGASVARSGLFRAAHGGTLFLDEIGDLPREAQPALLRALEDRNVRPVGADAEIGVDTRIVAATNADLESAVRDGRFREDLLARLAHLVLRVKPLRQRRGEILELARSFAPDLRFTPSAAEALVLWHWPRNVRELKGLVESLALWHGDSSLIRAADLAERIPTADSVTRANKSPSATGVSKRRETLVQALERHQGNVSAAARELGRPRSHVYRWLKQLGIASEKYRTTAPSGPSGHG